MPVPPGLKPNQRHLDGTAEAVPLQDDGKEPVAFEADGRSPGFFLPMVVSDCIGLSRWLVEKAARRASENADAFSAFQP